MKPAHHKIVIVAGIAVLVIASGCARNTAGVRRIELVVSNDAATALAPESEATAGLDEGGAPQRVSGELSGLSALSTVDVEPTTPTPAEPVNGQPEALESSEVAALVASVASGDVAPADEVFMSLISDALRFNDLCHVWDTLEMVPLDARVPSALAQQMRLITEVMGLATPIVPPAIVDDWTAVTDGFEDVAGLLSSGSHDAAAAAYDDPAFAGAQGEIAGWVSDNCA